MGPGRIGLGRGKRLIINKPATSILASTHSSSSLYNLRDEEDEAEEPSPLCTPSKNTRQVLRKRILDLTDDSAIGSDGENDSQTEQEDLPPTGRQYPKRGKTRNIRLANQRRVGAPLFIAFNEEAERIIGKNSKEFINELGCVLRKMARFNKPNFDSQDEQLKEDIITNASDGFSYDKESPTVKRIILMQLSKQFRNAKHKYHAHFKKFSSKEEALKMPPDEDVLEEDWISLCDQFDTSKYKLLCEKNAVNRGKSKTLTTVGTKSIARMCEEKKETTGEDMNPIEAFEKSRFSKEKKGMIDDYASDTLERLKTLQATTSLTPLEICNQELGWIPGHHKRYKSKKSKATNAKLVAEAALQKQRADDAEKVAASLAEEIRELKDKQMDSDEKFSSLSNQVAELLQRMPPPEN